LAGVQLEISQYCGASVHNNAMIKNGCKPSLAMIIEQDNITQDQVASFQETLRSIAGAKNSGRPVAILGKVKIEKFSESIRDMDFDRLKAVTTNKIAQILKIPLPLINENSMTFSNFSQAQLSLYDTCILPIAKKFLAFLNNRLLPILGESKYKLVIDESAISALELRKIDVAGSYGKTNALTINEIRTMLGYEALSEGGDVIYQPQNMVPIGKDGYTVDNREAPTEKAFFISLLKEQDFDNETINQLANKYFDGSK
jgi:HK97 family phage portal protein